MSDFPRAIEVYETSDGMLLRQRSQAEYHQSRIDGAAKATAMLEAGSSLGAALRAVGFIPADWLPVLDEVFESTKLVISHWQCRDEPGYRPRRINSDGTVYVFGDAGSWSGCYGSDCSVQSVADYWQRTKEQRERAKRQQRESRSRHG